MAEEQATFNLKVLSPSSELEGGVTFTALPTSTTVGQLRNRIQDAVPSKPSPDRMRLIYRGRVVADNSQTLEAVFGADNIRDNKDQSLHLVLPPNIPSGASPTPRSSTAPPNPFRATHAPTSTSPSQTNPPSSSAPPATEPDPSQPHHHNHPHIHSHIHDHHHHHNGHVPAAVNPLGVAIPASVQQQIAQALAQNGQPTTHPPTIQGPQPMIPVLTNPAATAHGPVPAALPGTPVGLAVLNAGPNNARVIRQEGVGPNGARWSVTINEMNMPAQGQNPRPGPFPHLQNLPGVALAVPPVATPSLAEIVERILPRLKLTLESSRQSMQNAKALHQTPRGPLASPPTSASPPSWRRAQIRSNLSTVQRNLDLVERELNIAVGHVPLFQRAANPDLMELRRSMYELRTQAEEMTRRLDQDEHDTPNTSANTGTSSSNTPAASTVNSSEPTAAQSTSTASPPTQSLPSQPQGQNTVSTTPADCPPELFLLSSPQGPAGVIFNHRDDPTTARIAPALPVQNTASTLPADCSPELFLLYSPQGPVGLIYDQRGTYTTAPLVPTLPFQTFTGQFAHNRQLITGLGQQIAHGNGSLFNHIATAPAATQTRQPMNDDQNPEPQNNNDQQIGQAQVPAQAQAQNGAVNPPAADEDRLANIGGHVWLILKLACFVYFFAGGGSGYYRPIVLGIIAAVVYIAQTGIFEDQFNALRRHFEALLPIGALAQRVAAPLAPNPPRHADGDEDRARNQVPLTPEQAAQRLLRQQREQQFGWAREGLRSVERAFALFVASLWPGVGEGMVHAQEERERLERVARREEEERRAEEERKAREDEEKRAAEGETKDQPATAAASAAGSATEAPGDAGIESSAKGKERAVDAEVSA
ncbi:hypothetical protein IAQ61_005046 [Plenodomus lingam]|uniref:uncharacterized protein n=1 Tax=Leptosphaeria maculans TaxID=5022 RepID=UPI00331A1A98|nr:hypothetical protein IAQ61_005046 [Plenodomus lingam]